MGQALEHTTCSALHPDAPISAVAARRGNAGHAALNLDTRVSAKPTSLVSLCSAADAVRLQALKLACDIHHDRMASRSKRP